ncbi:hypothetical protein JHK87_018267 [Glycine soja]|nr:hypothetical protein JHK87_018267 [Glycine soja]
MAWRRYRSNYRSRDGRSFNCRRSQSSFFISRSWLLGLPRQMKTLSWNCRGLDNLQAIPVLKDLLRAHRPEEMLGNPLPMVSQNAILMQPFMKPWAKLVGVYVVEISKGALRGVKIEWQQVMLPVDVGEALSLLKALHWIVDKGCS